jgi:hypothetical protein
MKLGKDKELDKDKNKTESIGFIEWVQSIKKMINKTPNKKFIQQILIHKEH